MTWVGILPIPPLPTVHLTRMDCLLSRTIQVRVDSPDCSTTFPELEFPTKRIQYDLASPRDITGIQILTGNDGLDGRVFSTTAINASTDGGGSFAPLGYFESDPPGTINGGQWGSTLVRITDDAGGNLVSGATNLIFEFYAVDNTGGQYRDPFDGVNPFTNVDDGLSAAFVSPLVWEIDVVPEPGSAVLMGLGLLGLLHQRRRS